MVRFFYTKEVKDKRQMRGLVILALFFGLCNSNAQDNTLYTSTAIIFISRHGTTEKVANMIKDSLGGEQVALYNLKRQRNPDISQFNRIIIGGSIHAGRIQSRMARFCKKNEDSLLSKELGIYLCCLASGDAAIREFNKAYPEKLRQHAKAKAFMGYELYFEKMNPLYRIIMKKISGEKNDVSKLDMQALEKFLHDIRIINGTHSDL